MGWLIFFALLAFGCILQAVETFVAGNIGSGFLYLIFPIVFISFITYAIIVGLKQEKLVKAEIKTLDDFLTKWKKIKVDAEAHALKDVDLFKKLPNILKENDFISINEEENSGFRYLNATSSKQDNYMFILQETNSLDFDSLADFLEVIRKAKSNNVKIFYLSNNKKGVYNNLMKRCLASMDVSIYNNASLIKDAQKLIADTETKIAENKKKLEPPKKIKRHSATYGSYEKIFPNMVCSDDDPDYLKQIDDWEWMEDDF